MTAYIATFHTHLAAIRSHRALAAAGIAAQLSPVPRYLSSSCGTCVRYFAEDPLLAYMDADAERVVALGDGESYTVLFEND